MITLKTNFITYANSRRRFSDLAFIFHFKCTDSHYEYLNFVTNYYANDRTTYGV